MEIPFRGAIQLVAPEGLSVISDIDDTIKISHVTDKQRLLEYSFLRRFEAVPGMAKVYQSWEDGGAVFHYVSSSPWQLYPALADFMSDAGFPRGSCHLRYFRVSDESFFDLFTSSEESKPPVIEALLEAYPRREFVLVGDSGERDPEIYGAIARAHPGRIRHIHIRLVTSENKDSPRMQTAFAGLPQDLWSLFEDPSELSRSVAVQ
jgi:phosphatidate phosphatase APP1